MLQIDVLGHAFEDDVAVGEIGVVGGVGEVLLADGQLLFGHEALVDHLAEVRVVGLLVLGDHLRTAHDQRGPVAVARREHGQAVADHAGADYADVVHTL